MTSWRVRALLRLARWTARLIRRFPAQVTVVAYASPWVLFVSVSRSRYLWTPALELYVLAVIACALMSAVALQGVRVGAWTAVTLTYGAVVNLVAADFAYLYWSLSAADPSSFSEPLSKADASYFAWATMTTTGFGDVVPRSDAARLATTVHMALTFLLVGFGIALLTGTAPRGGTNRTNRSAASSDG